MPACSKPPPPCCPDSVPCKDIRWAAVREHTECVKHFWGLRDESDFQERLLLNRAVATAFIGKDTTTLEFMLSHHCPWDESKATIKCFSKWADWRDTTLVAFKYKMPDPHHVVDMLRRALECCDWDFLTKAQEYGYDVETEANVVHFANQPDVPALKELLAQDAFSTVKLTWLIPQFASERNDQALLEFALQLQGTHDLSEAAA